MKLISWNCTGAFRKKAHLLSSYNADICVIQEWENPDRFPFDAEFLSAYLPIWTGTSNHRGLAIFVRKQHSVANICLDFPPFRDYILVTIDDLYILGVWTHKPYYIENLHDLLTQYSDAILSKTIIVGDFNSNAVWDKSHKDKSHSHVVQVLKNKGISSAWHTLNHIEHGKETTPTHFFHKSIDKPFHIDYCFAPTEMIGNITIGSFHEWIAYSDHMPLIITLKR